MPQVSVAQLFEQNRDRLKLTWLAGRVGENKLLDSQRIAASTQGLVDHLNFLHPNWIQVLSSTEIEFFNSLDEKMRSQACDKLVHEGLACVICTGPDTPPPTLLQFADSQDIALLASPVASLQVMWVLRYYLARALAASETLHGVFLDVLGMGVLLTGESGVGKSELALELISRGSGLVADDVVELYQIAPEILEGRCPPLLKDFLEVRGLGMLNIRTIFGETAVRIKKNLKLIIELKRPIAGFIPGLERLPLDASTQEILGVPVRKVVLPVAAGRNLAVLVEAAVRNYVLQLRGIDSTREFMKRHDEELGNHKDRIEDEIGDRGSGIADRKA
ncbi:MAG TPA: HPr(Ser) kinase/phosphatase [Burkholderiales bacterium]|nr:HPr(Ser) kinase/phosphatase [Burkholderiales bacterium]